MEEHWMRGPFGLDASGGGTRRVERTVLVVVPYVTAGTRLADVVPLVECDPRIQVVYTQAPSAFFGYGAGDYLRALGGRLIGWHDALSARFDLALAATHGELELIHAPILFMPHGVGFSKFVPAPAGERDAVRRATFTSHPSFLLSSDRLVHAAIAMSHENQRAVLERDCPEAARIGVVAGDPAYDRMLASLPQREAYREALGVGAGQRLVVLSSTWGPDSLLGRHLDLPLRLMTGLPRDRYAVAMIVHPNAWSWHSPRQLSAWMANCQEEGLRLIPPEEGWQATLVAGDMVIGDSGSVTYYGAALGRPVILAAFADRDIDPESQVALLGRLAPRLDSTRPIRAQLEAAIDGYAPMRYAEVRARASSLPGGAASRFRRLMYELMTLHEPSSPARSAVLPAPVPVRRFPETPFGRAA